MRRWAWSLLGSVALMLGCGDDSGGVSEPSYRATVVRTEFGIPHVTAEDWGSLGFGNGWAYAQDNFCILMREVIRANGETMLHFGEDEGDLGADMVYRYYNTDDYIETEFIPQVDERLQEALRGYVAGINKFLDDTGVDQLAQGDEGCRAEPWVRPLTENDLYKVYRKLIMRASTGVLTDFILDAQAPTEVMASLEPNAIESTDFQIDALGLPKPEELGSNAYALGGEVTQTGAGILLGNPHFPWVGTERWTLAHLQIPGELNIMGASLNGVGVINIGFNENLAWSHTVSTARRFTLYELDLLDDEPMKYRYDEEVRDIEAVPVTIPVKLADGAVEDRVETIYLSHFGPVVDLGGFNAAVGGWPNLTGTVFAFRDANLHNARALNQFLAMNLAQSVDELETSLELIGLPWVNTIAADRGGDALYGDVSTVPHVSADKIEACADSLLTGIITNEGLPALNGSRSDCEWGSDADGPEGVFGFGNLPKLRTRTYAANSNDSYWLSHPEELLTGFSPVIGREEVPQSLRTRLAFVQIEERLAGTDGLGPPGFTVQNVQAILYGARDLSAEIAREDVVTICEGVQDWSAGDCDPDAEGAQPYSSNPSDAAEACAVLGEWDGRFDLDSVGAAVWRELWPKISGTENLWSVPFDATDPVHTPNDLNEQDPAVIEAVRCGLGASVDFLVQGGVSVDRPWGEVQFRRVGEERIGAHGGSGATAFSVISARWTDGEGYSEIRAGNSYIQTVTWDEDPDCPDAYAILTYSQSSDPDSAHFADQTRLYSNKGWVDVPFCDEDIEAAKVSTDVITN